mmetsp:Transcript_28971/g.38612  ORF Transcript_28971/g.38612 Transcript_28971/m.38612 type:complete len:80 (-) Transcript_28971:110-349(-)
MSLKAVNFSRFGLVQNFLLIQLSLLFLCVLFHDLIALSSDEMQLIHLPLIVLQLEQCLVAFVFIDLCVTDDLGMLMLLH